MRNSEPIFARYLEESGLNAQYEKQIGTSNPDFSVWTEDALPYAFWDVVDREPGAQELAELDELIRKVNAGEATGEVRAGPTRGYFFVRNKVRGKYGQFKNASPIPGMLVLADWTGRASIEADMMAAALYGWPQMILTPLQPNPRVGFGRASDGKLNNEKVSEENRHISAIGILRFCRVNRFIHGLSQFQEDVWEEYKEIGHCLDLLQQEENRQRGIGIDIDSEELVLDIYLTDQAHHPWPQELCGMYDRIYSFNASTHHYDLIKDGLAPRRRIEVPKSDVNLIQKLPGFRNE